MSVNLKGRSLLSFKDYTQEEIQYLIDLSAKLKAKKEAGIRGDLLTGKNILLIFEKTSSRTRCSFEVAAYDEGAHVTYLDTKTSQFGKKESVKDSAKLFGGYYDGIEFRGYKQSTVEALAKYSGLPVWNGLTDEDHPTQALADLLTITECVKKPLNQCKMVFCGDTRNNMAYALMYVCAKMGIDFVGWGPEELKPAEDVMDYCVKTGAESGATFQIGSDISLLKGADVIYTDIWASMGEEDKIPERVKLLTPFKVTEDVIKATGNPDTIFMHCLPSFHDFETTMAAAQMEQGYDIREVTEEVFSAPYSVVFREAHNRMHTIKAIMCASLADL